MTKEIGKVGLEEIKVSIIQIEDPLFKRLPLDFLIKISVLSTIAGYLKINEIFINAKKIKDASSLENFLSFLLNDRDFAPIKYKIKLLYYDVKPKAKELNFRHNYNTVILFSGGFDSSCALLYALDKEWKPLLLWIGFGQKNEAIEEKVVRKIAKKFNQKLLIIKVDLKKYIEKGWQDWSYIIPARNFMFATFAAAILSYSKYYKNRIIIGVTEEEINNPNPGTDKSPYFFRYSSKLFCKFYKKDIRLITPFKFISKTELVAHWKNVWIEKYKINPHDTISCYYGVNCGICNACFKRSIAFLAGGVGLDSDQKKNPFRADERYINKYIKRCFRSFSKKKKFVRKRAIETLLAYNKMLNYLPKESKRIILNLPSRTKKELDKKERKLSKFVWK
jgi:7-cyano-7-deazaguanine synthase in queuosine biosynthesis